MNRARVETSGIDDGFVILINAACIPVEVS